MLNLVLAAATFLGIHLGSSTPLRRAIVGRVGEGVWTGLFSLASIAAISWLVSAYAAMPAEAAWVGDYAVARWIANLLMPVALVLATVGLTTPNPATVGQGTLLGVRDMTRGINAVTRHPFFWAVILWSVAHMLNNAAPADLVFFGSLGLLSLLGTVAVDAKKRAQLGDGWTAYEAGTSNVPFAAIIAGRARFSLAEIGWWRVALGVLVWALMLGLHPWLFGANPLPA